MSKTAIANIGENDFDDWRQMFVDFAILHDVSPTPEGVARTWGWLCDPTHPETGLIVRVRDDVVGFVHYRLQPSALRGTQILYLDDLFIAEAHRGSGVADDMMDRLREIAQTHGCSAIRLDTHATNKRARRFYERQAKNTNWTTYEMTVNSM
jgi:ribosomal protein S18 acetylase RimI-like enzyme